MHPPKKYRESCYFIKKSLQSHPDWLSMEVDDWDCICPEMKQCFRNVFQHAVGQENQRPKNKSAENPEMLRNETQEWTPIDYSSVHLDSHDGLESWNEEWALLEARWTNPHGEIFPLEETSGMVSISNGREHVTDVQVNRKKKNGNNGLQICLLMVLTCFK
jgi:hypothetical protein